MTHPCPHCGIEMEAGTATPRGMIVPAAGAEPRLVFVVPGTPTSGNPIAAFKQGMAGEPDDRAYLIRGYRCPSCGRVELFATERAPT
jgi:predicted RNA-binding Zn-ribbon protein involved in translation (DUF1610 family)